MAAVNSSGTLRFFVFTLALSWVAVALAPRLPAGGGSIFVLALFMPALVAIWLTARSEGPSGLEALFARVLQWRVGLRWYGFAIGYMLAIRLTAALIQRVVAGSWPGFGHEPGYAIAGAILASTPFQAGEEIGWRGYALPRLARKFGFGSAGLIVGVVWAVWHFPLFFLLPGNANYGQSFPLFFLGVVPLSVAMTWLYVHTKGSILLAMLMHSSVNQTHNIVQSGYAILSPLSINSTLISWLTILLLWLAAGFFLIQIRRSRARFAPLAGMPPSHTASVADHN